MKETCLREEGGQTEPETLTDKPRQRWTEIERENGERTQIERERKPKEKNTENLQTKKCVDIER